jgi:hypothetical protein
MAKPPNQNIHIASQKPRPTAKTATHESIADDLEAFERAGGRIEVLGVTSTLKHIGFQATPEKPKDE